jgi:hypothetical protein
MEAKATGRMGTKATSCVGTKATGPVGTKAKADATLETPPCLWERIIKIIDRKNKRPHPACGRAI